MVKVLHGCVLDIEKRLELLSKTKGNSRRRRAGVVKLTKFCTPFSATRMVVARPLSSSCGSNMEPLALHELVNGEQSSS